MSKADKMFEELGYKKNDTTDKWGRIWGIDYQNPKKWTSIKIDFIDAEVCGGTLDDDSEPIFISMQELQAINEKCKELRMDIISLIKDTLFYISLISGCIVTISLMICIAIRIFFITLDHCKRANVIREALQLYIKSKEPTYKIERNDLKDE